MDIQHLDASPETRRALGFDAEAMWDARAEQFNAAQFRGGSIQPDDIVELLQNRDLLAGKTILDVGGGAGRYALPFARSAAHVAVTDLSSHMLSYARGNAEREGRSNLSFHKLDWETADLRSLDWESKFDLVFSSMCPATRSAEGIDRMSAAARGQCVFTQVVSSQDLLGQYLRKKLRPERTYDGHNDRAVILNVFSRLWTQGYEPEVFYLRRTEDSSCSAEEAAVRYAGRYGLAAREQNADLTALIRAYADGDSIRISNASTLAILLWRV